jgi:hypothetical protein
MTVAILTQVPDVFEGNEGEVSSLASHGMTF